MQSFYMVFLSKCLIDRLYNFAQICFYYPFLMHFKYLVASDDGCVTERYNFVHDVCEKLSGRIKRSNYEKGPESSRSVRQVFTKDVENPRHVVDRAESDNTGFRSPTLDQRLWPGGVVPYKLDPGFGKFLMHKLMFGNDY